MPEGASSAAPVTRPGPTWRMKEGRRRWRVTACTWQASCPSCQHDAVAALRLGGIDRLVGARDGLADRLAGTVLGQAGREADRQRVVHAERAQRRDALAQALDAEPREADPRVRHQQQELFAAPAR